METPTSTGTATEPEPIKPWKQVAEESNIFSLPAEQRVAEYDKWSQQAIAKGIRDGDFDSPDTFSQFKLLDIRTRKNLASDDIVGPSDDDILADYNSFSTAFQNTQQAFASQKPTPEDNAIQGEVLQGKRNAAFVRGQMVFNPTIVNDPQKYREAILESNAPPDIKMFYAGLRPEMEKSATITRRRELANSVITRDVADKVVNAIQEGTEVFGADIGTPQSPALKKNKAGVWSVVDPEYSDIETSFLGRANAKYNPLADSLYKPLAAINEYQKKYGLSDEQVQQDYMEALIENAPTAVNRWVSKATSVEEYVKQLDSTVRVKNRDVAPEVRVQDPNLFFDAEGYNAAVDKANAPDEAKNLAKEARTQFADAVAGDIYNNLLANRDDFREDYAKDVVKREDMAKAITRYYKDKKDQAWYDDVGEMYGQAGTALGQGLTNFAMTPSAILGMFGNVEEAEKVRYATMVQNGQMQAEEAVANRTGGAGVIKLNNDVMRIMPDLAIQMGIAVMTGGALSFSQAAALSARTGLSRAAARTAIRQAMVTGEKAALKTELAKLIPNLSAQAADDVATGALEVAARTMSNNPLKGGIGTQRAIGSAYAGLTSAGSTFGQVYTEVRAMGKSPEESIGIARTAGITAGAITGALTHTFGVLGRGGVEDFASMGRKAGEFTIRDIVKSGVRDVLTTQEGRQLARSIASGIAKDALHEGVEEGLDQALNLISQYATNPSPEAQNRKVSEVINESLYAMLLGILAGGGANVVGQARVTAPGITAQQMQAEILGANAPQAGAPAPAVPQAAPQAQPAAAPQAAPVVPPVVPQAPVVAPAPVVQPTPAGQPVNPAAQQAAVTAQNIANTPGASQTAAALAGLANAAVAPVIPPALNLPVVPGQQQPFQQPAQPAAQAQVAPVAAPVQPQAGQAASNLTGWKAQWELAKIAKLEGVDLTALNRTEYADYAVKHGLEIDDSQLRMAASLRNAESLPEFLQRKKAITSSSEFKTASDDFDKWSAGILQLAGDRAKGTSSGEVASGVTVRSGTATSNTWLFFKINQGADGSSGKTHKTYVGFADLAKSLSGTRFTGFMQALQQAGYQGDIKTGQDFIHLVAMSDQIVMHGRTEADADLAAKVAQSHFGSEINFTDKGVDAGGKSYSQIISDDIKQRIEQQRSAVAASQPPQPRPQAAPSAQPAEPAIVESETTENMNVEIESRTAESKATKKDAIARISAVARRKTTRDDVVEVMKVAEAAGMRVTNRAPSQSGFAETWDIEYTDDNGARRVGQVSREPSGRTVWFGTTTVEPMAEQPTEEMKTTKETPTARDAMKPEQMTPEKGDEVFVKGGDDRITRRIDNIFTAEGKQMVLLQGLQDPISLDKVVVDPKSDYRKRKQRKAEQTARMVAANPQLIRQLGDLAVRDKQPVGQDYINATGGGIPKGYVKEGELYVFKGEEAPAAEAPAEKPAAEQESAKQTEEVKGEELTDIEKRALAIANLKGTEPRAEGMTYVPEKLMTPARLNSLRTEREARYTYDPRGGKLIEIKRFGETIGDPSQRGWLIIDRRVTRAGRKAPVTGQPAPEPELTPEQQDFVVFMDEQNDEIEERQKPKKKRITPGEARKIGTVQQINNLGIKSNDPESVIGTLKKIAAKPPQPHHARIAKDLLSVLEGSGTSIVLVASNDPRIKKGDERVNGWYDPATNTAYINLDGPHELGIEETILHELVHASGERVIRNPQTDAQKRILGDLQKQMEAATKNAIAFGQSVLKTKETDLEKLIKLAKNENNYALFDILYGVSSLSEYHAHATTSRAFQRFLSEYKEGSRRNFFERFVNSLTRLLSGTKTAEGSDAEKSYATLLDLMRENKGDVRLSNTDVVQSRARGVTAEMDAAHAAAYARGDAEAAQQMVDAAAKAAGWNSGDPWRVTASLRSDWQNAKRLGDAIDSPFLFKNFPWLRDIRLLYDKSLQDRATNAKRAHAEYQFWDIAGIVRFGEKIRFAKTPLMESESAAQILIHEAVHAVQAKEGKPLSEKEAYRIERQIKSAEPFTFDEAGNLIPLSQRFQPDSPDIRFSRARGRFDLVDAVRAASSGDASTPFVALNEAINANTELTRRIQAESERRSRAYARGKGAILEQIIRAGNSGRLPQESIKPLTDFVNSVSAEALADTRISLSARPRNSTFDFTDSLVTLALNGLGSDPNEIDRTGVHEFWHGLSRFLPDDEIEKMRVDYVAAVKEYISENPWFVPFIGRTHLDETQYDELSRLLSKDEMNAIPWKNWETLDDGRRIRGLRWSRENYRLFRLDEWVAETMADLVRRKQERPTTILGKMARLFRDFLDTLKQALGNPYLRALDAMTMPDEAFDAVIQRYGPIEDNPPVMYGGPAVGVNNQFILGMYAGEKALENLPEEARAFKRDSLKTAQSMAASGKNREEIRAVTGWFPGPYDGKMRWEIPDNKARFVSQDEYTAAATKVYGGPAFTTLPIQSAIARMEKGEVLRLGDIMEHPELFAAYPGVKDIPFFPISGFGSSASFRTVNGKPMITATVTVDNGAISNDTLKSVLHEIQHYIQTEEGFAIGGSANGLVTAADLLDANKFREPRAALQKYQQNLKSFSQALADEMAKKGFAGFGGPSKKRLDFLNSEIAKLTDSINAVWAALKNGLSIDEGSTRAALLSAINRVEDVLGPAWVMSNRNEGLDMLYRSIAGEIEARDVEARQSLTPDQRAAIAPYSSENIAPGEAIVRFSKARGIVSDAVVKFAPQFNVVDAPDGPSVEFDGRSVTVNPEKLANLEEYEVQDLANRAVVAAIATPKDPIAAGIIQQTMAVEAYNFDSESRKGIRKSLADAHRTAHEFGMAPLAMELGNRLFEFGGATDADVRKSIARGVPSDEKYADAYKRGDTEAAQEMVNEAAKAAGLIGPVSHATDAKFNEFKPTLRGRFGKGMYFSDKYLSYRGGINMRVYLENPQITEIKSPWKRDSPKWTPETHNEYFVRDPSSIKSAEPFTFDDSGALIPLSQRFQPDSPDIRYSRARGTELVTRVSGPALAWKKFISGFRSRGMVSQETYDAYRDSDAFKKANAAFVSFIAKDFTNVTNKLFGEGGANLENFRVFSRDATTGEATVSSRSFDTRQKAEAFAATNRYKDYIVSTGQDLINQALGSNGPTLKEDVRDAIEKLTKKGLDDIAKSIEAYKEEYLDYWNTVMMQAQPGMIDPAQIATLRDRKEQWMAALRLRSEEQKKLVDDARKKAVQAAIADAKNRIAQQQQFAKAYLPDDLVHQIERAREKIDELSTRLTGIKWLMEGSELQMVIEGLNGVYVTRSYEAFETSDKAAYVAWLNEAYSALTNRDQVYDPIAMERIMPLVRHIKNGIMERRIEDLKKENDQRQVDAIMEDLMADSRQVTQVDRVPGQPIEGTEYEKLIQAVAKRDLLRRRSDEKKRFVRDMMRYLDATVGFASNIGNRRKRVVALRKEANRIYNERYGDAEQQIIADMFGRPQGLQWALMTDDEAHDIANVERAISESPGNLSGSAIWTSSINGNKHSTFNAAVNDDFKENLNFILKAPGAKTSVTTATANDWKRLGDKILEHKNDVPAFLRTFLGEKDNPLLRVSDTIMKQSHLVAVGNLYQNIADIGNKAGWLVSDELKDSDQKYNDWVPLLSSAKTDQGYENNPLKGMYADPVMAKAIDTLLAANQPSNSAFKAISIAVGVSLWGVTAGSVRAIVRNLASLPIFLMNSGILGAILNPTRWPIVAKNVVLASRMVQQSMEATGKISGGKQINNKAFKLVDWAWTKIILSGAAVQRPALYAMKGAATMAEFASRMTEKPTAEQSQEMYLKAVRLGVANDNVQKEAIHRLLDIEEQAIRKPKDKNMGRFAKALKLEGAVGFGSYLLGTTKTALQQRSQLYGAPDDFTKILAWLNEMDAQARINAKDDAQYDQWRGKDGLFSEMPDDLVKKAADNVTNLIQSHSRVWAHITQFKKAGFGTLAAPFAAARAEFYRNAANAYIIAFEEMRSDNPKEQTNGQFRFASALMAHFVMGNAIGAVVKTIFSAFADDDEIVDGSPEYREAVRKLGPEYAKNKNATYILYKNGTFDWVDLSFADPFSFFWSSITAARRGATEKDVEDNIVVEMTKEVIAENIGTFAKPQIALDAYATVMSGYDSVRGVKIWDSQADSFGDKFVKSVSYYMQQAGLPGDYKDGMKIWKAAHGVEENGRQYKVGTEVGAVFLGTSIRTVNITDALEQKLAQAKDTLGTRITPLYKAPLRNANDVEMEDVALAVQQYAKAHDQAVSAMQKSYKAAETLLRETPNAKTLLRNVMSSDRVRMSQEVERSIVTGKPSFPGFSDQTLRKMGDLGKKHDDPRLKVAVDTLKEYNQKKKNP